MNIPYVFQNGQVADGSHVSSNFDACKTAIEAIAGNATHTGDVTGSESLTIGASKVVASMVNADINTKVLLAGSDVTLTDGATISINWSNGATQAVTLGGNRTFNTPTNPVDGQVYRLIIKQDGTGTRTITWWATSIKWAGGTAPTLTTTASKADIVTLLYDGTYYYASATLNF